MDGVVIESFDGGDGWEKIRFMVWDEETKRKCRNGYQISCAYVPGRLDEKSGLWHNVPYDAIILDGTYTHFAIVPNPRYEGAVIFANSLKEGGTRMFNLLFGGKTVELDKETKIVIDGKETPLSELVNSLMALEATKAKVTTETEVKNALADDKTPLEVNGKKVTLGELKEAHKLHLKNAEDAEAKKKAEEAAKNAADEEAKKKAAEDEAAAKKNAEDAEAKKKAEEAAANAGEECGYKIKQNADGGFDVFDKEMKHVVACPTLKHAQGVVSELHGETKKNAEEMAEKAKLAEAAKAENFNALRKAAQRRNAETGALVTSGISTPLDKEDLGRERYGSPVRS